MNMLLSFSGGRTSAFMTKQVLEQNRGDNIVVVFANTGQETEETLKYIDNFDKTYGFNTVWIEAVTHHDERKSCSHRVVDYETACRDGAVFMDMIKKYGVPNLSWLHCTRELKANPVKSFAKEYFNNEPYIQAIGIRSDESRRIKNDERYFYPLNEQGIVKEDIEQWEKTLPFELGLMEHEGNCKLCFKKSLKKHIMLVDKHPDWYGFAKKMQSFDDNLTKGEPKRPLFRGNRRVEDLFKLANNQLKLPFDVIAEDTTSSCGESCESF